MKMVQVPATEKQVIERLTCDLCGAEIKRERFNVEEVTVKHRGVGLVKSRFWIIEEDPIQGTTDHVQ